MTEVVWVRGVAGRLTRIEQGGKFLPIDRWTQTELTRTVQRKADRGSLQVSYHNPDAKPAAKTKPTAPPPVAAEPNKEESA